MIFLCYVFCYIVLGILFGLFLYRVDIYVCMIDFVVVEKLLKFCSVIVNVGFFFLLFMNLVFSL